MIGSARRHTHSAEKRKWCNEPVMRPARGLASRRPDIVMPAVGGTHDEWIQANCRPHRIRGRLTVDVHGDARVDRTMADARSGVSVLGYVAVDDEHSGLASDVLDRVPAAEHAESRHAGAAIEAR